MAKTPPKPVPWEQGDYITDGRSLLYIVQIEPEHLRIEDCKTGEHHRLRASELGRSWKRVRRRRRQTA